MEFDKASRVLDGIPYTSVAKGRILYDLARNNGAKQVLELGFAHGCSTCYFAAAVEDRGGSVDAVDLAVSAENEPNLETLVGRLGLDRVVRAHRERSSYTWWLRGKIEAQTQSGNCTPCYDLVFIDGPKDWTNDGAAFFMADKLLHPGGLIVFDDMLWTYEGHERRKNAPVPGYIFSDQSNEERALPQVSEIFRLLAMQHPSYSDFEIVDDMLGIARKVPGHERQLRVTTRSSLRATAKKAAQRAFKRLLLRR